MSNIKKDRDSVICIITAAVILVSYAAQRLLGFFTAPTKTSVIVLAMVNTVLLLMVTLVLLNSRSVFFPLLTALIGFKMLPVDIPSLAKFSADADLVYFFVVKAAVIIFAFVIYKIYRRQEEPKDIKPLPIVALMFSVTFFNEIGMRLLNFFLDKTGSMLYGYFSQYACYIAAALLILGIAWAAGYESLRFACYFEFAALAINIIRTLARIALRVSAGVHISKSFYGWLIVYAALMVVFAVAKSVRKKKECSQIAG